MPSNIGTGQAPVSQAAHGGAAHAGTTQVVIFAPHFEPGFKAGGALRSLVAIFDTAPSTVRVLVITRDRDLGDTVPYPDLTGEIVARGEGEIMYLNPRSLPHWVKAVRTIRQHKPQLIYLNSLWNVPFSIVPFLLRLMSILPGEVLLAPRGQLSRAALSKGRRRLKVIGHWLWRQGLTRLEHTLHCTDGNEATLVEEAFPGDRLVISMDPVALPAAPLPYSGTRGPRPLRAVYVGRVAPVKNLSTLFRALTALRAPLELEIVGPLEDSEEVARLRAIAAEFPEWVHASFVGPLPSGQIRRIFAESDLFLFPSLSENFGHVVPEALSASCPVIMGDVTPFTHVVEPGGGQIVDQTEPAAWTRAISGYAELSPEEMDRAHLDAGQAYVRWISTRDQSHVLDLVLGQSNHRSQGDSIEGPR